MNSYRANNTIKGAGTALVTPFLPDGTPDLRSLAAIVEENISAGIDFLCVLGTTAETPTLSEEEKNAVRKTVIEANAGRVPLLLGYGGNNTAAMVQGMARDSFKGFDALLIVTPYYNKPNQEGLFQHYRTLSRYSLLPIVLYNVPGRTGVNVEAATTLRIARECPNVVGIKEASGRIEQIKEIISARPEGFAVLSGDDALSREIMLSGGDGAISVVSNARPAEIGRIIRDPEGTAELDKSLQPLYKALFEEGNPVGIKAMLSLEGKISNVLRLPLVSSSAALVEKLKNLI